MPSFASQFSPHHRVCLPSSGLILTQAKAEIYLDSIASGMLGQPTPVCPGLRKGTKETDVWWHVDPKLLIPLSDQWKIIRGLHDFLHLGRDTMSMISWFFFFFFFFFWSFTGKELLETIKGVTQVCALCAICNPGGNVKEKTCLGENWQIDFTQMPSFQGF